jgi:hypothetical protein
MGQIVDRYETINKSRLSFLSHFSDSRFCGILINERSLVSFGQYTSAEKAMLVFGIAVQLIIPAVRSWLVIMVGNI